MVSSFVPPIHFLKKKWGEVDKILIKFMLYDYVHNSHDHSVLQSIDITRRNLMLKYSSKGLNGQCMIFRLQYIPLVVVTSCLDEKKKNTLKGHVLQLGM